MDLREEIQNGQHLANQAITEIKVSLNRCDSQVAFCAFKEEFSMTMKEINARILEGELTGQIKAKS